MKTIILSLVIIINLHATQNSVSYNWETFIQKALDASFKTKQDDAQLVIEKSKVAQSTLWENPTLEMSFDDGLENSVDYTYVEVSQKLPAWGANSHKKRAAQLGLESAGHSKDKTILQVQYEAASLFQKLYFLKMQHELLDQQLAKVQDLQDRSISREDSGEISSLQRTRIDILKYQLVTKKQSLNNLYLMTHLDAQTLLNVDSEIILLGDVLKPNEAKIEVMIASLEQSPKYRMSEAKLQVAKEELALAKATRYALPELYLYSEREVDLNNDIGNIYGFGFRLSLPLWNTQNSQIEMKNANIQKIDIQSKELLYKLQRRVSNYNKLYQKSLLQFKEYKKNLLEPSKKYYEINAYSFELGEKSLLELLDAQTLYFESQLEYYDLVLKSNIHWLQLCEAASINLLKDN